MGTNKVKEIASVFFIVFLQSIKPRDSTKIFTKSTCYAVSLQSLEYVQ